MLLPLQGGVTFFGIDVLVEGATATYKVCRSDPRVVSTHRLKHKDAKEQQMPFDGPPLSHSQVCRNWGSWSVFSFLSGCSVAFCTHGCPLRTANIIHRTAHQALT